MVVSLLLQVWYPSPGVDPFKQEDFLQVDMYLIIKAIYSFLFSVVRNFRTF